MTSRLKIAGLIFLKVAASLNGCGYILVALLASEIGQQHGWLTQSQLLTAIALGQITP